MLIDPRKSDDPLVRTALAIWDRPSSSRDESYADAANLRNELRKSGNHQAYGWATATCGCIAAYQENIDFAEEFLTEALGRFILVGDDYGRGIVTSHLAIPQVLRSNLDRSIELALAPFRSKAPFTHKDLSVMHGIAAMCYCEGDEFPAAISHLNKESELLKQIGDTDRIRVVTANIGALLLGTGEFELALDVLVQAQSRYEPPNGHDATDLNLPILANIVGTCCQLDRLRDASAYAELLVKELSGKDEFSTRFGFLINLAEVCARTGRIEEARQYLRRARQLPTGRLSLTKQAEFIGTEAQILEATGQLVQAIEIASKVWETDAPKAPNIFKRTAAATIARCYAKLGNRKNSDLWARHRKEIGRESLLGDALSKQVRANLRFEQSTVELTEQELKCLRLSANGQTSSDIGLKLGIKPRTVNFHFGKILRKLNAMNRQEAIAKAVGANLIR